MEEIRLFVALFVLAIVEAKISPIGCGERFSCFGKPDGCLENGTKSGCDYLVKLRRRSAEVDVEIVSEQPEDEVVSLNRYYVAAGFSKTPSMDESFIFSCVIDAEREENLWMEGLYAESKKPPVKKVSKSTSNFSDSFLFRWS